MSREVLPIITNDDIELMEKILSAGNLQHKYAISLQTVLNRAKGKSTNDTASFLGINLVRVSRYVHRYDTGGIESLLRNKTRLLRRKRQYPMKSRMNYVESSVMKNSLMQVIGVPENWEDAWALGTLG